MDVYRKIIEIRREEVPKELIKKLKMLHGLPPYNGGGNICQGDGYFANSIDRDYGAAMVEAAMVLVIQPMLREWRQAQDDISKKFS